MTAPSPDRPPIRAPDSPSGSPGGGIAFLGDSEMAGRIQGHDWEATPLGSLDGWPATLRVTVAQCLRSRFPTALWWGPDLLALYNDGYAEYLGRGKHPDALGRPYREVWSEIWDVVAEQFTALLRDGKATFQADQQFTVHRNGYAEEAFFTYNLSPVVDPTGRVVGALNVVTETTGRVLAERRMRALQLASGASAGARTVLEAGEAIAAQLARHPEDLAFAALYRVVGDRAERIGLAGLTDQDVAPPELSLEEEGEQTWPLRTALRTGEPVRVDGLGPRFELPGGAWPEPVRQALVVPLERGDLHAVLVAGTSPRRPLDREYHRFLVSLGDTIAAALADAQAQERERSARLDAEKANRAKSEFLTAMSHELRTPLNAIAGYVDLLDAGVHGSLTDGQVEALERIAANQRHLLTLINDILLFARIEAASLEFRQQTLLATELVESLEPLLYPLALKKDIDYAIGPCDDDLHLRGDRERVRQILLNLAANALKFTPRGGRVRVRCATTPEGGAFEVTDTGPGIAPERQADIFDPFSQVERRLDSPQEGAGLGLAISRDMARAMGGDVTVESEPGEGATFRLTLPGAAPEEG